MNLLLDANISWRLVNILSELFGDIVHVDHIGLPLPPSDIDIWEYAHHHNLIIVTKDDDFLDLVNLKGFPPKVLLLKVGNLSSVALSKVISEHVSEINELWQSEDYGVLEIY